MKELKVELFKRDMNYQDLADLLGISIRTVQNKMNKVSNFNAPEIAIIKKRLKLSDKRVSEIFY